MFLTGLLFTLITLLLFYRAFKIVPIFMLVVVKDVLAIVEFSTDYDPDNPTIATWIGISILRIRQSDSDRPGGEPQTQTMIAGHEAQAAELTAGSYAVVTDDGTAPSENANLETLRLSANNITPVWFRETPSGGIDPRVIGGQVGCLVTWGRQRGSFGDFEYIMVGFTATGAAPDSTFTIESGS